MKKKVSFVTVGHSPREDIMDELQSHLSEEIEVRQLGALDSLSIREVKDHLTPVPKEAVMTSRLSNGEMMDFSKEKVMPLLLQAIRREEEAGVAMIVILCTTVSDRLHSRVPIIVPFDLLHKMTAAVRSDCRVGALFPFRQFAEQMKENWIRGGVDVTYECMAPKELDRGRYLDFFKKQRADMLVLDCISYTYECRDYFVRNLGIPVIHPRTVIVSTIHDMLGIG